MYLPWGWIIFIAVCIWYMGYNVGKNEGKEEAENEAEVKIDNLNTTITHLRHARLRENYDDEDEV